jgi:hypothetical protein
MSLFTGDKTKQYFRSGIISNIDSVNLTADITVPLGVPVVTEQQTANEDRFHIVVDQLIHSVVSVETLDRRYSYSVDSFEDKTITLSYLLPEDATTVWVNYKILSVGPSETTTVDIDIHYHCDADATTHGSPFVDDDEVVVLYNSETDLPIEIVGFVDVPVACNQLVIIGRDIDLNQYAVIWNIETDTYSDPISIVEFTYTRGEKSYISYYYGSSNGYACTRVYCPGTKENKGCIDPYIVSHLESSSILPTIGVNSIDCQDNCESGENFSLNGVSGYSIDPWMELSSTEVNAKNFDDFDRARPNWDLFFMTFCERIFKRISETHGAQYARVLMVNNPNDNQFITVSMGGTRFSDGSDNNSADINLCHNGSCTNYYLGTGLDFDEFDLIPYLISYSETQAMFGGVFRVLSEYWAFVGRMVDGIFTVERFTSINDQFGDNNQDGKLHIMAVNFVDLINYSIL